MKLKIVFLVIYFAAWYQLINENPLGSILIVLTGIFMCLIHLIERMGLK